MWTSTITEKKLEGKLIRVHIKFDNGDRSFGETFVVQNKEELNARILAQFQQLEKIDELFSELPVSAFVPEVKDAKPQTPLQIAESNLYRLKSQVDLGILSKDDKEYVDAVTAYKSAR